MQETNISQSARCHTERYWFPTPFVAAVICLHLYRESQGALWVTGCAEWVRPPPSPQKCVSKWNPLLPLGHTTKLATT